jgi:hypothetical protein
MGAHRGENRGTTIENKIETSDYKTIHYDKGPYSEGIHYMELKVTLSCVTLVLVLVMNPLHGVKRNHC